MEGRVFGILLLSGLASSLLHHQYVFISEPRTWPEAVKYCREKYTDLATIYNEWDMDRLAGVTRTGTDPVFLGLHRLWAWSLSNDDDYKEGEEAYWNWASGQALTDYCGSIGLTGEWFAKNCSNSFNFLCYNASVADISKRFILGNGAMTWLGAQAYCRERHTDLARVRNRLENQQLQRIVSNKWTWIGLSRTFWMWSDGTEASFKPWRPGVPLANSSRDCASVKVIDSGLGIIDTSCDKKQPYCCYGAQKKKRWVKLKLKAGDSSVNMNDPAVMESVSKWVQKKLGDEGISKDVRTSWWKRLEKRENPQTDTIITFKGDCHP